MSTLIMLDAAFPPSPRQWVADMRSVGASAGAVYVYGPFTNYSVQHVSLAMSQGFKVLPTVVPGNDPPDPAIIIGAVHSYGIVQGPIAKDREPGSLYSSAWSAVFDSLAKSQGFVPVDYANLNDAIQPPEADDRWLAEWLRTGVMQPVPLLPAGLVAWQFVDDVAINGSQYDVSIVSDSMWGDTVSLTPDEHDALMGIASQIGTNYAADGIAGTLLNGNSAWQQQVSGKLSALAAPSVDVAALAAAIVSDRGFLDAISTAVAHKIGSDLTAP